MAPKVLVIAHAFAPAAPIGTMRPLRVVRRLAAEGWTPVVLMASPHTYAAGMPMDPTLLGRVPANAEIVHAPVFRPLERLSSLFAPKAGVSQAAPAAAGEPAVKNPQTPTASRGVRAFLKDVTSIPDREIGWVPAAVVKGWLAIRRTRARVIYSTAPPWTGQLVAYLLARITGLPWVADFRDPWARAPWRESLSPLARTAAAAFERRVVARADAVIFSTHTNRNEYAAHYGEDAAARFFVVPNGCDPEELRGLERTSPATEFVIVHAGSLYGARTPEPLLGAIASAIGKGRLRGGQVRLRLIGASPNAALQARAAALGLTDLLEFVPRVPRRDVLEQMAAASALLVLQPATTVSIPGKLYEYLAMAKPILAFCEEGETADLVRRSGLGAAVTTNDEAAIEAGLLRVIELARTPLDPPAPELYDGNRSAAQAVAIVAAVSERAVVRQNESNQPAQVSAAAGEVREWRV